jgi:hypothetical protein
MLCSIKSQSQSQRYFTTSGLPPLSSPWREAPWDSRPVFFWLNACGYSTYVTSSLTRGWVCSLQLLLALASAVILRSDSRGTRDHILLSQIRDSPKPGGPGPPIYIPRNRMARFPFRRFILIWTTSYIAYQYPRKRRLILQRRIGFQLSIPVETSFIFESQEPCSVTNWFPRIHLYGNVCHLFPSNGSTCHNSLHSNFLKNCTHVPFSIQNGTSLNGKNVKLFITSEISESVN